MAEPLVTLELSDAGVAELTFCAAPVNQLSQAFFDEMNAAADTLPPDTRALAILSDVPGVFMAGGDIEFLAHGDTEALHRYVRLVQDSLSRFEDMPWPVVAGIDGACLGGGLELALACDIRIVSEAARLGLPEVSLGILPGGGGTQRLVRAVGQGVARDLLLTGRRITGSEALTFGVASRLVEPGAVAGATRELVSELAAGAWEAIRAIKRLAVGASDHSRAAGLAQEVAEWIDVRASANAQEGLVAFLDKRPPAFS